ncbi:hypothetical protein H0H87_009548 [Tephrocybe sp. NHM501043]|nr:hypothetical protein H0H87_009548 [Tephrocybe sp. NHM501043]
MPSIRAIFLLATATFTALTTAAPTGLASRADLDPLPINLPPKSNPPTNIQIDSIVGVVDNAVLTAQDGKLLPLAGRGEVQSLPAILAAGKEKLTAIYSGLNSTIASQDEVDIDTITPFLTQCHDTLAEIVANVKLVVGHPDEIVLGVTGTAQEVAELLSAILTLVTGILTCVLKVVGPVGATASAVVKPLLEAISDLLLDLIPTILSLVQGLLVIIASVLNGVIKVLSDLGLGSIVKLLEGI